MKKKAFIWGEAIKWALGIFILGILIFLIFFPEQLLSKARDAAFYFGIGLFKEEVPEFLAETRIPEELSMALDDLVSKFEGINKEVCLLEIGKLPLKKGFSIYLINNKLQIEKEAEEGLTPAERIETVDAIPCEVTEDSALNFYKCYVLKNKEYCGKNLFFVKEKIKIGQDGYGFLYKSDNNFCLINIYRDLFRGCDEPRNTGEDGLDDDCIGEIEIDSCSLIESGVNVGVEG